MCIGKQVKIKMDMQWIRQEKMSNNFIRCATCNQPHTANSSIGQHEMVLGHTNHQARPDSIPYMSTEPLTHGKTCPCTYPPTGK